MRNNPILIRILLLMTEALFCVDWPGPEGENRSSTPVDTVEFASSSAIVSDWLSESILIAVPQRDRLGSGGISTDEAYFKNRAMRKGDYP